MYECTDGTNGANDTDGTNGTNGTDGGRDRCMFRKVEWQLSDCEEEGTRCSFRI